MPPVEIVVPTPDEWQELRALRLRSLESDPLAFGRTVEEDAALTEETWRDRLERKQYIVAKSSGKMVGMVALSREKNLKTQHVARIVGTYVAPEARGQGIGRMLMEAIIAKARADGGILKLRLTAVESQLAAQRLYESLGFVKNAEYPKELKNGDEYVDEIGYELFLK